MPASSNRRARLRQQRLMACSERIGPREPDRVSSTAKRRFPTTLGRTREDACWASMRAISASTISCASCSTSADLGDMEQEAPWWQARCCAISSPSSTRWSSSTAMSAPARRPWRNASPTDWSPRRKTEDSMLFKLSNRVRGSGKVGEMGTLITEAFQKVDQTAGRRRRAILVIDEGDSLAASRVAGSQPSRGQGGGEHADSGRRRSAPVWRPDRRDPLHEPPVCSRSQHCGGARPSSKSSSARTQLSGVNCSPWTWRPWPDAAADRRACRSRPAPERHAALDLFRYPHAAVSGGARAGISGPRPDASSICGQWRRTIDARRMEDQ